MKNILFTIFFSIAAVFLFNSCSSVEQEIPVLEKNVLEIDELILQVGEEHTFKVTLVTNDVPAELSWTLSNPEAVLVKGGVVKALAAGTATIEVRSGEIYGVCEITVLEESESDSDPKLENILLDCEELNLNVGEQYIFRVTLMPEGLQADNLVWTSDNLMSVAIENGVVTALQVGDAVATVTCADKLAECKVTVIEASAEPVVGYYYSDGIWSARLLQEKEVVGIVFYVENPAEDEVLLAKEHVHGLVVSINEIAGIAWQSGYDSYNNTVVTWIEKNLSDYQSILTDVNSEDGSRILGYNHKKAIEAFNVASENSAWSVEVVQCLDDFRNSNLVPDNSSGWYLPSAKELSFLSAGVSDGHLSGVTSPPNLELVNTVLGTIAGAAKIQGPMGLIPASCYTSSEASVDQALMMTTYNGTIMSSCKSEPQKIRPVLAF